MSQPSLPGRAFAPATGDARRSKTLRSVLVMLVLLIAAVSRAQAKHPISGADDGPAIGGYDPVAYFTIGKPVSGDPAIQHVWNDATWLFASEENRRLFIAAPEQYAPQYGGYCAYATSLNRVARGSAKRWQIVDGKLYLNANWFAHQLWQADVSGNLEDSERHWEAVRAMIEARP